MPGAARQPTRYVLEAVEQLIKSQSIEVILDHYPPRVALVEDLEEVGALRPRCADSVWRAKVTLHGRDSSRGFTLDHTFPRSHFASCTEYTTGKLAHQI